MTRFARGFKKKHVEATSWEDLKDSETTSQGSKNGYSATSNEKIEEMSKEKPGKFMSKFEKKQERNREARRKRRSMKKICFHCRKPGHALTDCQSMKKTESPVDLCFKCGSTEHKIQDCRVKVPKDSFPFAKCFVCGQDGHISRKCPDNPRGLYPLGGGCKFCDSVEHFKRDCPENPNNKKNETNPSKVILKRKMNDFSSADAVTFSDEENEKTVHISTKKKKPAVVKF